MQLDELVGARGRPAERELRSHPRAEERSRHPEVGAARVEPAIEARVRFPGVDVRATSAAVEDVVAQMRTAAGDRDLWCVGGGQTATWLHAAGLLDEVWVSIAPVLLGDGIPVISDHVELELVDVDRNRDFAVCRYRVSR